ncbi:MAG: PIN domain-containing protein [Anaerolineae bacterium]|nr:PIN domain-containing protein [Phycisphaerae bacterium]
MPTLIDTSVWIDFTRARSPQSLKQFIAPYILDPAAHLAEPIAFEVLRHATPQEALLLNREFETFPMLETPADLWRSATRLGQSCRKAGINAGSLDLLIAGIALAHNAMLITFDDNFRSIAKTCHLQVELLSRPR